MSSPVWRCRACDGSDWQKVLDNAFGHPDTRSSPALEAVGAHLYFVAGNEETGLEVWRTLDGANWEQVGRVGFGNSNNEAPYCDNGVTVFNNRLFIGTENQANGAQVWLYLQNKVYSPLLMHGT